MNKILALILFFAYSISASGITTIIIHGTRPPKLLRKIPAVYVRTYRKLGFIKASNTKHKDNKKYRLPYIPTLLNKVDNKFVDINNCYLFGWSGKLDPKARLKAAHDLYLEIKKHNLKHIRLITHSHGGNVALNLVPIVEKYKDKNFKIEELVLLACPVQKMTSNYLSSSIFNKKYNFHSHGDLIQVVDPQKLYKTEKKLCDVPLFSQRHFRSKYNIAQVRIKSSGRDILHSEFLDHSFIKFLPTAMNLVDNIKITHKDIELDINQ